MHILPKDIYFVFRSLYFVTEDTGKYGPNYLGKIKKLHFQKL